MLTSRYSWLHISSLLLIFSALFALFLLNNPWQTVVTAANPATTPPSSPNFAAPAYYDTGGVSTSNGSVPVLGDFNGDNKLDIAVTNYDSNNFGVLLGKGDGSFQTPITTSTSARPLGIAAGDFNGDGKLDLVIAHFSVNGVNGVYPIDIFAGDGTGHFTLAHSYTAGLNPAWLKTLDLNNDGNLDIVVCNNGGGSISVLLGNGDGSFQNAITTPTASSNAGQFALGDFNGDSKLDLAVTEIGDKVSILLGNGNGTFQSPTSYPVGKVPSSIEAKDLNGDGKLDLAIALDSPTYDYVLLGNGDGTFNAISSNNPTAALGYVFSANDFNADNKADLAWFGPGTNTTQFRLLAGVGDGTFQDVFDCVINGKGYFPVTGDVNNDGKPDIVLTNYSIGKVTVLVSSSLPSLAISNSRKVEGNNGTTSMVFTVTMTPSCCQNVTVNYATADGTATTADNDYQPTNDTLTFAPGETSKTITVTVNSDTKVEPDETFVVNLTNPVNATIGTGQGVGTILNDDMPLFSFSSSVSYNTGGNAPQIVKAGDFNGDGKADLAVSNLNSGNVGILLGNGDGTFQPALTTATGASPFTLAIADLNGDNKLDLVVVRIFGNYQVDVLLGNGDGTFQPYVPYSVLNNPQEPVVGDFNNDGKLDIAVSIDAPNGQVALLLGNGDGTFQPTTYFSAGGSNAAAIAAGDFNGDGKLDLAVSLDLTNGQVSILLGNGNGTFQTPSLNPAGYRPSEIRVGDLNGDSKLDLVFGSGGANHFSVLLGNGNGTFQAASPTPGTSGVSSLDLVDFNGDGKLDIVWDTVVTSGSPQVGVALGNGDGTFQPAFVCNLASAGVFVAGADFSGDGKPDFAVTEAAINKVVVFLNNQLPSISINDRSVVEGNSGTVSMVFTVTMTPSCCQNVTVNYATADGTATLADNDYVAASGTLTFSPGEITKTITVVINGDTKVEPDETFAVNLTNPVNATLTRAQGIGTIINDDLPSIAINNVNQAEGNTGTTPFNFTVSLSSPFSQTISVQYTTSDGTAKLADSDYVAASGTLTFASGEITKTVTVLVNGDTKVEPDETFAVNLTNPVNATIGTGQGVGTILNDDVASFSFSSSVSYNTGGNAPQVVKTGDFNGDGKADLAVSNINSGNVGILLSNGDGTFQPALVIPTGTNPFTLATADFNGDGKLDLAVVRIFGAYQVDILLGKGDGTFQPYVPYTVLYNPQEPVVGDFNNDGKLDIAVSIDAPNGQVAMLLGNGDGTFQPTTYFSAGGANASSIATGDFNGDGRLDLAVSLDNPSGQVAILLGNGNGTFQAPSLNSAGYRPSEIRVGDLNGDSKPDLVFGSGGPNNFSVLLGNGNGTFQPASPTPGTSGVSSLDLIDFNGDGKLDIVWDTAITTGPLQVGVALGNGDGTFQPAFVCNLASAGLSVVGADFNSDGKPDFAVTEPDINKVVVFINNKLPSISINDVTITEPKSGTTSATFTVILSGACCQSVQVNYATADGTATLADNDYVAASGTLTFAPGEITKTVTITVNGDTKDEPDETFFVNLTNPVNVTLGKAQGVGTITEPPCDPSQVVSNQDDGQASTCGTLSYALAQLGGNNSSPVTITFSLTGSNTITMSGPLTPTVKSGVVIKGNSCANPIVINGNGVSGDGLRLSGNDTLINLWIKGFAGRQLIVEPPGSGHNILQCVKASKT